MGLSKFFIDRPVFAWVIAVVVMLAGGIAAFSLPIEQYPTIAPPAVVISATYPGADSESLQNSVTQVIEQQLTGLDNLLYFSSSSNADGTVLITATFAPGTSPDIAQVQVQNKVQAAVPLLPSAVFPTLSRPRCRIRYRASLAWATRAFSARNMPCGCGWTLTSCTISR
jgi:multidrug efflux pump